MKTNWIQGSCVALALSLAPFAAQAADMPYYKSMPQPAVDYQNWSGAYVGLNFAYGFGNSNWDTLASSPAPTGVLLGLTLGSNWQVGALVYGVEADIAWSSMKDSDACGGFGCETRNNWLGTARGRLGTSMGRLMAYVTGGMAFGDIKANTTIPGFTGGDTTRIGWTIGGGLEFAVVSNWTAKVEYLYVDLGRFGCGGCAPIEPNVDLTASLVRFGLNYKFGGPFYSRW